jgi:molybdopterin synthase sulfur carrier subunit
MSDSVRVLLFAAAREAAGTARCELDIPASGANPEELLAAIVARFPVLGPYTPSLRIAINGEYTRDDSRAKPGDEVAVLPPLAGG